MVQSSPVAHPAAHPAAHSVSEKIDPAEPPVVADPQPLTDAEQKRLIGLSESRVLTEAEQAELDALGRRADIPRPPVPGEPIHDFLAMVISEIEVLASRVSVAHDFGSRIARLKAALEALKAPSAK